MKDNNSNNLETNNLTTEAFHKLLAENTTNQNELRFYYAQQLADIQDKYNKDLDKSSHRSIMKMMSSVKQEKSMREPKRSTNLIFAA